MSSNTLVDFLLARLDEDEEAARGLAESLPSPAEPTWEADGRSVRMGGITMFDAHPLMAAHIARHDPTRTLAEVEAKRRIVQWMGDTVEYVVYGDEVLRALAAVYVDHPDYAAACAQPAASE